jgi:hypothetical protein
MGTIRRPRIVSTSTDLGTEDLPEQVTVALYELVGAAKEGLLALSVAVGLAVVQELFEAEVTRLAGPKGKHDPDRPTRLSPWPGGPPGHPRWSPRSGQQTARPQRGRPGDRAAHVRDLRRP